MATIWFCQIFSQTCTITESVVGVAKGAASRKHHNGRIERRSTPPPQCSPLSSRSASACPLVVSNCTRASQVANLSVIILKAKETWANLYAGIREGRRELKALAGEQSTGHRGCCNHLLRCFRTRISLWLIIVKQTAWGRQRDGRGRVENYDTTHRLTEGDHNKQFCTPTGPLSPLVSAMLK